MRIAPTDIAFDVDGVVADTMTLFIEILKKDFGINRVGYEDIVSYDLEACLDCVSAALEQKNPSVH